MIQVAALSQEKVWLEKFKYDQAEKKYYEKLAKSQSQPSNKASNKQQQPQQQSAKKTAQMSSGSKVDSKTSGNKSNKTAKEQIPVEATPVVPHPTPSSVTAQPAKKSGEENEVTNVNNSLASEVAKARHHIKTSLQCIDDIADIATTAAVDEISVKVGVLEKENSDLKNKVASLTDLIAKMEIRLNKLESGGKVTTSTSSQAPSVAGKPAPPKPQNNDDDDDGVDLFGSDSDEDDAEAAKIKEQRLAEYAAKKSKKPALVAKSNIILDVKPWDDETDMKKMEQEVRKIVMDGLVWGASKLVPLAYGIHKLQISCVVEDDKVSVDLLQETIEAIEDYVQSVDVAAFNKV